MKEIAVLDQNTIDKIAAGEVVERPSSVVKELVENAIDAKSNAITAEIKEGGISFIRITDNGEGIARNQVPLAFLRHSTSKIKTADDLLRIGSLGFRGEALSSIAAVSQVELITKQSDALTGIRYCIEGGSEKTMEEIGAPEGTTFLVRNLFYNTPARKKFLKTAATEGSYISEMMNRIALSHPEIAVKFILNGQTKLHSSGNGSLKDIIYSIYGREITANLVPVQVQKENIEITGFIGKPIIARSNRNHENIFVNGRYIKSSLISRAVEMAYKPFMMQHKYPFVVLHLKINGEMLDVNVHPTKMEVRFSNQELIYQMIYDSIKDALEHKEFIPEVKIENKPVIPQRQKELFTSRTAAKLEPLPTPVVSKIAEITASYETKQKIPEPFETKKMAEYKEEASKEIEQKMKADGITPVQMDLFEEKLLEQKQEDTYRIIGQLFRTYWLIEFQDKFYMMDQHAAHEKVNYEKLVKEMKSQTISSQMVSPPIICTLTNQEQVLLQEHLTEFEALGFQIEAFGGEDYAVSQVPDLLSSIAGKELFTELLDQLSDGNKTFVSDELMRRIATMSCKASVKGNQRISEQEAAYLIRELMKLENPYHCPHGRPTLICMSKYEIEKKFKRIVS